MAQHTAPGVQIEVPPTFRFAESVLQPKSRPAKNGTNGSNGSNGSHVTNGTKSDAHDEAPPPLDILAKFTGTFSGDGFNTIFRPDNTKTPTPGVPTDDNVLMLNITKETMVFASSIGSVPNRGSGDQGDIFLNGLPYTQSIDDVTEPVPKPPGIHFETGLWMRVPASTTPPLEASFARMASIPHGTTINAQGFQPTVTSKGAPNIPPATIQPFLIVGGGPVSPFQSQTASNNNTPRLPKDLTSFVKAGTITQAMIDNPNIVLANANKGKDIVDNITFSVSTAPTAPDLGGGTSNIGFLVGDGVSQSGPRSGNANAVRATAQYWISTVRTKVDLKPFKWVKGDPPAEFSPKPIRPNETVPVFLVEFDIPTAKTVTVEYTQIQYSQNVTLDFATLSWPHITVATLVPMDQLLDPSILNQ